MNITGTHTPHAGSSDKVKTTYYNNLSKIHKELGWSPKETFESGIKKTIEWYKNN